MHREIIEIEMEVEPENMPMAVAQAAQMIAQISMPNVIRQLAELQAPVTLQVPTLTVQTTPRLENKP